MDNFDCPRPEANEARLSTSSLYTSARPSLCSLVYNTCAFAFTKQSAASSHTERFSSKESVTTARAPALRTQEAPQGSRAHIGAVSTAW